MSEDMDCMNRRNALRTIGAFGIGASSIGVVGGMTESPEIESVTISSIPTEPEDQVYSFTKSQRSWPGDYEISHTMEWFRSEYTESGTWRHDFSIQSHACSRHSEYDTLVPECTGWGYRIEKQSGYLKMHTDNDWHGVNPEGVTGDMPEWTDVVMEGAIGTLSTTGSLLYTATELRDLMDPADGFDTTLDDGFRWLHTYGYTDDGAEQVSSHHRVELENDTSSPIIEANATVRIKHDPFGDDEWLDVEVTTNREGPIWGPDSEMKSSTDLHPEDMTSEEQERLGIKKVEKIEDRPNIYQEESRAKPEYIMTNCPWDAESETKIVRENRNSTN